MSQNRMEFGVGCRSTLSIRCGWPMSTTMKPRHMTTAPMAMNSPKMTMCLNFL
jgi:hypothetical protein